MNRAIERLDITKAGDAEWVIINLIQPKINEIIDAVNRLNGEKGVWPVREFDEMGNKVLE
jgi:hypothetical protein